MGRVLTKGSIVGNLLAMSVPTMFGMLGQTLYDVVDLMWVGRISVKAVAGVTLFTTIFWFVDVLNEVIGVSSIALITQSFGSGDQERTARVIEQTIVFKVFTAVIAAILMFIGLEPLLRFFTNDAEVLRSALDYGHLRIFFLPVFFATFSCFTALRSTGDPTSQMWIMLGSSALNAVLAPIFMFKEIPFLGGHGLGLGVYGAALATVIAITVSFVIGFSLLVTGKARVKLSLRGFFTLNSRIDAQLITIGLPSGGEMLARQLAGVVTMKFVAFYGTAAIAVLGIGNRLAGLVFMPLFGLMSGGGTIVGQCLGAKRTGRAERTARAAALIGGTAISVMMVGVFVFPRSVLGLFVDAPEVISIGVPMIRIFSIAFAVASFGIALGCAFSGSGHNMPFLMASLAGRWGVQVPILALAILFLPYLGRDLGLIAIWLSFLGSDLVESALLYKAYHKGDWKRIRI